jgi:hypothetical protein
LRQTFQVYSLSKLNPEPSGGRDGKEFPVRADVWLSGIPVSPQGLLLICGLFAEELTRIAPPPLENPDEDKEMIRLRPYQKFPSNSAEATKCDGYVGRSTPSQEAPLGAKDL